MNDERRGANRPRTSRVLVVDDSTTIRRIISKQLESAGYVVAEADHGLAGIDVCRRDRPDLVLLDVDMPRLDGRETLQRMKADRELREIPVLFLTAHTGGEDVALGLELGAQDYIRKPCEPAELLARVGNALRMESMRKTLVEQAAQLDELSSTDPLTGLGNRRRLGNVEDLAHAAGDESLGYLLLDIDYFKAINDTEGHAVGDLVLQIVARRLQGIAHDRDVLLRWGGEEFLVVVPGAGPDDLVAFAEVVRDGIGTPPFAIGDGRTLQVTVSIGCIAAVGEEPSVAIAAADTAMYAVKQAGRNGVHLGTIDTGAH